MKYDKDREDNWKREIIRELNGAIARMEQNKVYQYDCNHAENCIMNALDSIKRLRRLLQEVA